MNRPGIWKRCWRGAAESFVEGMLMTNPVAYADYVRCKAGVNDALVLTAQEQVVSVARPAALLRGVAIHDPVA